MALNADRRRTPKADGRAAHRAVTSRAAKSPQAKQETHLAKRMELGDVAARQELIELHRGLATTIARRYLRSGVPLSDLVQEGCVGLIQAADNFDWRKGVPFGAYAALWIHQAVRRAVPQLRYPVRIPAQCLRDLIRVSAVVEELTQQLSRPPSSHEILQNLEQTMLSLPELDQLPLDPVSLDTSLADGEPGATPAEFLADPNTASPEECLVVMAAEEQMRLLLATLSEREQQILVRRLGLFGEQEHSFGELAELMGLSRQRVKQIEFRALEKLRDEINNRLSEAGASFAPHPDVAAAYGA